MLEEEERLRLADTQHVLQVDHVRHLERRHRRLVLLSAAAHVVVQLGRLYRVEEGRVVLRDADAVLCRYTGIKHVTYNILPTQAGKMTDTGTVLTLSRTREVHDFASLIN